LERGNFSSTNKQPGAKQLQKQHQEPLFKHIQTAESAKLDIMAQKNEKLIVEMGKKIDNIMEIIHLLVVYQNSTNKLPQQHIEKVTNNSINEMAIHRLCSN